MELLDFAFVVHRTADRLRLRVPGRRNDSGFFADLERKLEACDGIVSSKANPLTGSVILRHTRTFEPSTAAFARLGLACAVPEKPASLAPTRSFGGEAKLVSLGIHILAAAVTRTPALQLVQILVQFCVDSALEHVLRPRPAATLTHSR
jgi:hypothetical protein